MINNLRFKNLALLLSCALLTLFSAGCARKAVQQESAQQTNDNGGAQASSSNDPFGRPATPSENYFFRGEVGGHKVEMRLVRDGQNLSGSYSYANQSGSLSLKGAIDDQQNVTLQEFDPQGTETGVFKTKWKEADTEPTVELEGKWSKPNGRGEANFDLLDQHLELGQGVSIVTKRVQENRKGKYKLDVEYPQVEASADERYQRFNREIAQRITKEVNEWKQGESEQQAEENNRPADENSTDEMSINYNIKLATPDIISVAYSTYTYENGAAHGMSSTEVVNYDLKAGRVLELADLFQPSSNFLKQMADFCIKDLKRQSKKADPNDPPLTDESIEGGAAAETDNYQAWNVMRKGILVTFDPYQVGPYAAGRWYVTVPYSVIKGAVKQDGPIAQFANSDR